MPSRVIAAIALLGESYPDSFGRLERRLGPDARQNHRKSIASQAAYPIALPGAGFRYRGQAGKNILRLGASQKIA
jgi:hypothetical protein